MTLSLIPGARAHYPDGTTIVGSPRVSGLDFAPNSTLVDLEQLRKHLDEGWPITPLAKLAGKLGIKKLTTDAQGTGGVEHMLGCHPDENALQILTDAALDAWELPVVVVRSSEKGTGSLVSFAGVNKLGQVGLDSLRNAGYIVRVPDVDLEAGHIGKVSVFPNPDEKFLAELASYTGVAIADERSANTSPYQPPVDTAYDVFTSPWQNPLAH